MSQENQITLRGFVTAEPKFKQTALTATPLAEIRVGSTPRRLDRETGEWRELPTTYYTVKCWRRLAINAASSLHKGDMVLVRGRFSVHNWVDNQQRPRVTIEIEADSLGHDLTYGWSHFLRGSHPGSRAGVNAGETARQDTGESEGITGPATATRSILPTATGMSRCAPWSLRRVSQTPPVRETRRSPHRSRPVRAISPSPGTCR